MEAKNEGQLTGLIEFIAHGLKSFSNSIRVVALDHDVLKMPESPAEVLEVLALLQMASDLRAGPCQCVRTAV